MTEQFKTTAEYRHWMARHDLEEMVVAHPYAIHSMLSDLLPPEERLHWRLTCERYDARDFPQWFIKEVGELNDY